MLSLDIDERRGEFFNAMAFYVIRKEFVEPLRTKVDGRELKNVLDAANDSEMRIGNNAYSAAFMNETEMKTLAAQAGLLWRSVVLSDDVLCPKIVYFLCAAQGLCFGRRTMPDEYFNMQLASRLEAIFGVRPLHDGKVETRSPFLSPIGRTQ